MNAELVDSISAQTKVCAVTWVAQLAFVRESHPGSRRLRMSGTISERAHLSYS